MQIRLNQYQYFKPSLGLYYFILFSFVCTTAFGQTFITDSIQKRLVQYRQQNLQEKLYVHTDKTTYVAGETIWFKLYYIDGYLHQPLNVSKVAYVEILDADNKPLLQSKIKLQNGNGTGSIQFPFSVNTGNYTVRAYTAWMKNFDPQFFSHQTITIVNTLKQPDWKSIQKGIEYDFQLFPEGGHLVQGLESKIAFRITDSTGKGIQANGVIINDGSDTVLTFQTHRFGMGHFFFKPLQNQQYKAVAILDNGKRIIKDFPTVNEQGLVMKVIDNNLNDIEVHIKTQNMADSIYLISHCRQVITLAESGIITNNQIVFRIPKSKLGDGINHFTIFNASMQPLCERLYFKPPENTLSIQATTLKQSHLKREKANVEIMTFNQQEMPVAASLSASVHLVDSISNGLENNILTYLFLTSELKGSVEQPSYYFNEKSSDVSQAADNLMLVHGWTRFKWSSIFTKTKPFDFFPEYEGHIIKATLLNRITGKVAASIPVYFAILNNNSYLDYAESNIDGKLLFTTRNFYGHQKLIFPFIRPDDSTYTIHINSPYSKTHFTNKISPLSLSKKNEAQLIQYHKSVQIQHNYIFSQPEEISISLNGNKSIFFGKPDKTYWLDDYTRFTTMEEVLREFVFEVRVKKRAGGFDFSLLNTPYLTHFEGNPLVLLNGVPVLDNNEIINLNPLKIQKIDIIARKYFLGASMFDGIVSYSSYPDSLQYSPATYSASAIEYEGLQKAKEFFNPVYEYKSQKESRLPDFRNVLIWAPHLQTNKEGKRNLSFYTSDLVGEYVVIVEGITAEGLPGFTTLKLKVTD